MRKWPKIKVDRTQNFFCHCSLRCLRCSEMTLPILNSPSFTRGRWLCDSCIQINSQKLGICLFSFIMKNIAAKSLQTIRDARFLKSCTTCMSERDYTNKSVVFYSFSCQGLTQLAILISISQFNILTYVSVGLSACLSACPSVCLSVCLSVCDSLARTSLMSLTDYHSFIFLVVTDHVRLLRQRFFDASLHLWEDMSVGPMVHSSVRPSVRP